ncbi:MAG TPA: nucleotidyltransferase family protein [Anaerolineaceae bacterium]|nr:nucleotidyltransferase family protein [Anaerolineaceae bacterium]
MTSTDSDFAASDVIELVRLFDQHHIDVCIDGGWGVDALLGKQTRRHADLDIAIQHKDSARARALLEAQGYTEAPRPDTRECNYVMGDDLGHLIDIHTYTFDEEGNLVYGVAYPYESLKGTGSILGQAVKSITPEWMVKFHTGYPIDENDYHDVKALCQYFGFPIPEEYHDFMTRDH